MSSIWQTFTVVRDGIQKLSLCMLTGLVQRRTALGEAHPSTLNSMSNLVSLYIEQGRYPEAELMSAWLRAMQHLGILIHTPWAPYTIWHLFT